MEDTADYFVMYVESLANASMFVLVTGKPATGLVSCLSVCVWAEACILFEFVCVCLSAVSWQAHFVILLGKRQLGLHLKMDNARQEPVRRRGNPTQCLSTNCVFAVFLLGAQYNKVPFAVYCSGFNALWLHRILKLAPEWHLFFSEAVLSKQRGRQLNQFW